MIHEKGQTVSVVALATGSKSVPASVLEKVANTWDMHARTMRIIAGKCEANAAADELAANIYIRDATAARLEAEIYDRLSSDLRRVTKFETER